MQPGPEPQVTLGSMSCFSSHITAVLAMSIKSYLLKLWLGASNLLFLAKWIARKTAPRANIPGTTLAATTALVPAIRNTSKNKSGLY